MKTINRKPLFLALAGITALGAVGTAQAVSVSQNGLGQVLIYPYYTVKGDPNPFNTLISIVNTTASVKAVKVRFREGKASAEVYDFNLFLSGYDVWVAGLSPDTVGGGVTISTPDKSCTIPIIYGHPRTFNPASYQGDAVGDNSLARLREGYMEVIEMTTYTDADPIVGIVTHVDGVPGGGCTTLTNGHNADKIALGGDGLKGGLTGTASLVSPGSGINAAEDPVALINFRNEGELYITQTNNNERPTLAYALPESVTATDTGEWVWVKWSDSATTDDDGISVYAGGKDAVSAALMKNSIINEFVLDKVTLSRTDWVVTFPTKSFYVKAPTLFTVPPDVGHKNPFQRGLGSGGSCDDITINVFDREEQLDPEASPNLRKLCWEANVVTFNNGNVFSSTNTLNIATSFENGWMLLDFHSGANLKNNFKLVSPPEDSLAVEQNLESTEGTATFTGLPVIGFAVQTFKPPGSVSSYAGTFYHRFQSGFTEDSFCQIGTSPLNGTCGGI